MEIASRASRGDWTPLEWGEGGVGSLTHGFIVPTGVGNVKRCPETCIQHPLPLQNHTPFRFLTRDEKQEKFSFSSLLFFILCYNEKAKREVGMKRGNGFLEGFTLLELLVVLTIIGILMTIGMAAYTGVIESATRRAVEVELSQFQVAIFNFKIEEGRMPTSTEELLQSGYITRELLKDPWGEEYILRENEGRYQLLSKGPDKKAGTKDDIVKTLE